jgi:hypothetical protein
MANQALFAGLIVDEWGNPVNTAQISTEAHYVVEDAGFRYHLLAETIDRMVLMMLREQVLANKDLTTQAALQMLGKDDLFTKAMIDSSLKNIDEHLNQVLQSGLPTTVKQWLGMLGFRVVINYHGDVLRLEQPKSEIDPDD